ncbi:DUF1870 family protein [uncultured Halomonas sp.]|uniref:Aca2/YdiL-like domain-containing protein n=1 Tax=uncultured Halomonas sp. TaxID=173971 RepID=UPI00263277FC|nr:DUF1870 family protein [uncultured Halomonas sp.]
MNSRELQALRKFLMLDVSEAAEIIGGVSKRSWQYWEAGRSPVPDDVEDKMNGLMTQRQYLMDEIGAKIDEAGGVISVPFYASYAEFAAENPDQGVIPWRLGQSVVAELYANGLVTLG